LFTGRVLVGLDLGWKVKSTHHFVLVTEGLEVQEAGSFKDISGLRELIGKLKDFKVVNIFLDAPLHVGPEERIRDCDRVFLQAGIPILPVNKGIVEKRYSPFSGFAVRDLLEAEGFKYCGDFNEKSFFEVYAFGNAVLVFGVKRKAYFLKKWKELFTSLGFTGLHRVKFPHQVDALSCILPYFMWKWRFDLFKLYRERGYCLFVPGGIDDVGGMVR